MIVASCLNSTKHLGLGSSLPPTTPPGRNIYQARVKTEMLEEKMDKMVDELKSKINKSKGEREEAYRPEHMQFELENEQFGELAGGEHFTNDYFLGKREDPLIPKNHDSKDIISHPLKKQVSEHGIFSKKPLLKLDESLMNIPKERPTALDTMREELITPKPALNISLIDETYSYKRTIESMWDEQPGQKDHLFTTQNAVEDPMDEFQYRDDL